MCDPVTMAAAASAGGSMLAGGVGAWSAYQQGQFAKDMGRYQAKVDRERAKQTAIAAKYESEQAALRKRQLVGTGLVNFAANGLLLDGGEANPAAMWEQDMAAELAVEQAAIQSRADAEGWTLMQSARGAIASGKNASRAGTLNAIGSLIGGAAGAAGAVGGMSGGPSSGRAPGSVNTTMQSRYGGIYA